MATIKFTNFAYSLLASGATAGDTALVITPGHGARFPVLGVGDYCFVTLENAALDREIVKVTAISVDTLTVVRGQDNTVARAWNPGDAISLRLNAEALEEVLNAASVFDPSVYIQKAGDIMAGPLEVPAGATGAEVPQAQETIRNVGGAARIPTWTTALRPVTPSVGDTGFNTDLAQNESWDGIYWIPQFHGSTVVLSTVGVLDISGIPVWARKFRLTYMDLSSSGDHPLLQVGPAAGVVASGYLRASSSFLGTSIATISSLAGVPVFNNNPATAQTGYFAGTSHDGLTWVITGNGGFDLFGADSWISVSIGQITLAGPLNKVRLTSISGAPDAGTAYLTWSK